MFVTLRPTSRSPLSLSLAVARGAMRRSCAPVAKIARCVAAAAVASMAPRKAVLVAGALLFFGPVVNAGRQGAAAATPPLPTYKVIAVCELPAGIDWEKYTFYFSRGAEDINDRGQIVGGALMAAFFWEKGVVTYLADLPRTSGDGHGSVAHAINERGQVVGGSGSFESLKGAGYSRLPFLWENGKARNLARDENQNNYEAFDINDAGMVVGGFGSRGFTLFEGRRVVLGTLSKRPAGNWSRVRAVNNRGQFAGTTTVDEKGAESLPFHAFLWVKGDKNGKGGRMKDLGTLPGWRHSEAADLNERGDVVGYAKRKGYLRSTAEVGNPRRAVLWQGAGKIRALPSLPGAQQQESRAEAINNAGQIVGTSGGRAVLWQNGRVLDLNAHIPKDSGWVLNAATAVNNRGWIAGRGTRDGLSFVFLLTPQAAGAPEKGGKP
jgi:uncharacterized membrane protein